MISLLMHTHSLGKHLRSYSLHQLSRIFSRESIISLFLLLNSVRLTSWPDNPLMQAPPNTLLHRRAELIPHPVTCSHDHTSTPANITVIYFPPFSQARYSIKERYICEHFNRNALLQLPSSLTAAYQILHVYSSGSEMWDIFKFF